jgi:raffinose synthase
LVPPSAIAQFYGDFHRSLRAQGVDGLKVDNQAALEGLGEGSGGRIALMQRYREALEGSAHVNFGGNLINCMSCSTDMLYSARASNLVRSSDDFYPNNPETHGRHVVTNSLFGFWFGQFVQPDWDMFHSAHPAGAFHAAARAISGGPIYVSDKPGQHDFDLIKSLILADGRTARTLKPAVPTADSLLANVLAGDAPFKAFAPNASNWIVGAFHCHYGADEITVSGFVSSDDVPELRGKDVIAYADGSIRRLPTPIQLGALEYRLITLAEVVDGFSVIGLVRLLNPGGGVGKVTRDRKCVVVEALAGGEFLAYSQLKPRSVEIRSGATWAEIPFQWESESVRVFLPDDAAESQIAFRF